MTTVGKELKKIRKMYGLSQAEMSAGVVTLPYYGGVERGTKKISIDSLLKILEKNGISIYEFFGAFDPKETHRRNLENRIQMAYLSGDIDELDSLLALDEIQADSLQSLQLQLVRSEISGG